METQGEHGVLGFSRKIPYPPPPVEDNWIFKIPGGCKNFDGIPVGGRKNTGKFQGLVKVLMKFQGKKGKNNGKFHEGIVSENWYPQQGGPD